MHPFLPDRRAGYDEFRAGACRGGHALDAGRTDLRHEQIQGAEGQAGVRGDDAEPGNRLPCFGRGVRPADRRAGLVAVGPGHDDGDVCGLGILQHQEECTRLVPRASGTGVLCSSADNRHAPDVLSRRALHTGTGSLRLFRVGRLPLDAFGMVQPLHTDLPVASGIGPVQHHTGENPDTDAPAGHRGNAG